MERRYTTIDAAAIIGISPKTLRNLISKQRLGRQTRHAHLAYEYIGNRTVFRESVLKAWIEAEHQRGQHRYERRRAVANPDTDPRYVKLEDWDGRGYRCEHCGLVRWWKYEMKHHLAYRNKHGRCPVPPSLEEENARSANLVRNKVGRPKGSRDRHKRKLRAKKVRDPTPGHEAPQEESLFRCAHCKHTFVDEGRLDRHLERRKRLGYCKKPKSEQKTATSKRKPKPKPKRKAQPKKRPSRVKDWKKKPISVIEGWADDEYIGT